MPLFNIIPPLTTAPTEQWDAAGRAFSGALQLTVSWFSQSYQLFPAFSSWQQATTFNLQADVVARPSCRQSLLLSAPSLQGGNAPSVPEQTLGRCWASILSEDFSKLFNFCATWLCREQKEARKLLFALLHNGLEPGVDRYPESCIKIQNLVSLRDWNNSFFMLEQTNGASGITRKYLFVLFIFAVLTKMVKIKITPVTKIHCLKLQPDLQLFLKFY